MKKLTLTLLPLALSTILFAQSNNSFSNYELASQSQTHINTFSTENNDFKKMQFSENAGNAAADCNTESDKQSASRDIMDITNKKPKKKSNFNKGYSIAGEVSYTTGIGFYTNTMESGISAKHFYKGNTAVEAILSANWRYSGLRLTVLHEKQMPLGTNGFYWYWGIGAHTGLYNEDYWNKGNCVEGRYESNGKWYNCDGGSRLTAGIDGTLGLEYQFASRPFTLSLGVQPSIDLVGRSNYYGDGAFAFRYVF